MVAESGVGCLRNECNGWMVGYECDGVSIGDEDAVVSLGQAKGSRVSRFLVGIVAPIARGIWVLLNTSR